MTETREGAEPGGSGSAPAQQSQVGLSVGVYLVFAVMALIALVSASYAVAMIGFLGDGGYFISYSYLCNTVPTVAALDQFLPIAIAAMWAGCIYLGLARDFRFAVAARTTALISLAYAAINIVLGPFTFRVGPADFDPDSVTCGRWPRSVTNQELEMMQIDWLGVSISAFPVTLIFGGLFVYVFLRLSKRVRAVYRRPQPIPAPAPARS